MWPFHHKQLCVSVRGVLLRHTESVQISKSGTLWLPDKFGNVFTSEPDGKGGYKDLHKVAYVGPSRPLGHAFDADGNLVICDASKVC